MIKMEIQLLYQVYNAVRIRTNNLVYTQVWDEATVQLKGEILFELWDCLSGQVWDNQI